MALDDPVLCERTDARQTERNGHRSLLLDHTSGRQRARRIPKLRAGSFFPNLLEPRRRIDQALWTVIAQDMWKASRRAASTTQGYQPTWSPPLCTPCSCTPTPKG